MAKRHDSEAKDGSRIWWEGTTEVHQQRKGGPIIATVDGERFPGEFDTVDDAFRIIAATLAMVAKAG